jgi:ectoine hydroxylase-related dioxygenase (phytanoyl-CoA dioxygenase family)
VDATGDSTQAAADVIVDDATVAAFRRDGFVVVDGLIGGDELDRLAPAVAAAVARRKAGDARSLGEKSRYEQSFLQCQNLWEDSEDVRPLTFHPRVGAAAAALLGADAVRLWHDQALFKEPGGRETDPHQDQPYWPIAEARTITAWIPLHDVTLDGGCMGYVPGSHAIGLRRFVDIFSGDPEDLMDDPALADRQPRFVEVARGSVAFHHGLTAHLARPNRTGGVRQVHTVIYFADGCARTPSGQHPAVDRAGIRPGEPIRSDVTPVVWPRDPAEAITTPPPIVGAKTLRRLGILPQAT